MRLIDLNPRWFVDAALSDSRSGMGITFECPHCRTTRLHAAFENPIDGGPKGEHSVHHWARQGETFETLTLTPSIDVSASGHWHGFITNGEVT
jgi:hypothetical protein